MFNWAKQQLANVAGTSEPIYGPSAIKTVGTEAGENVYTEITRNDLKWRAMDSTHVESKTFYLLSDDGTIGMAQIIHSNVAGIRITATFNLKIFSKDPAKPHLWSSTVLNNIQFNEDKTAFSADDCSLALSEDGSFYTMAVKTPEGISVNLKFTRAAPGFQAGKSGQTLFGTDLENPWGSVRHAFWPRCTVEGTVITSDATTVDFRGRALYSYALQGMKPHHAACRWNFVNFQSANYSAIMMEFTTPPSYGSTTVNVCGIVKDGAIVTASSGGSATHTAIKKDSENDWPAPSAAKFVWKGTDKDGNAVEGVIEGDLGDRVDKVDVMAEVPAIVKKIVAGAVGTKPYIYQYSPKVTMKLKIGDQVIEEEGHLLTEATFISE